MAFEIGSTNLVVELGIILALLMGWQFTLAEFVGGPLMIVVVALLFRLWLRRRIVDAAREQADKGVAGSMEGHAAMDMSLQRDGSVGARLFSGEGSTSGAHIYVMQWAAVIRDIGIGLLIVGAVAALGPRLLLAVAVPHRPPRPVLCKVWGPLIGPVIATSSLCARSATCRWPGFSTTAASASTASSRSCSLTSSPFRSCSSTGSTTAPR